MKGGIDMNKPKILYNFFVDELENIEIKMRQMAQTIIVFIVESKFDDIKLFWKINRFIRNSGQAYLQEQDVDDRIKRYIYSVGYSDAILDSVQMYIEKTTEEREIDKIKTKYRDSIFRILTERRTIFHGDLAKALNVSTSALNDIIKHMNASSVRLVKIERISKYTLYSLTPVAYQYYMKNRSQTIPPKPTRKVEIEDLNYSKVYAIREKIDLEVKGLRIPKDEENDINIKKIEKYSISKQKRKRMGTNVTLFSSYAGERMKKI